MPNIYKNILTENGLTALSQNVHQLVSDMVIISCVKTMPSRYDQVICYCYKDYNKTFIIKKKKKRWKSEEEE
jgi:hypothetical protein